MWSALIVAADRSQGNTRQMLAGGGIGGFREELDPPYETACKPVGRIGAEGAMRHIGDA